jgi:hypothetical protein
VIAENAHTQRITLSFWPDADRHGAPITILTHRHNAVSGSVFDSLDQREPTTPE